jgi:hypothetical protein
VNVTSPTGIQEIDALEEVRLGDRVIEAAEIKTLRHRSSLGL